MIYLRNYWTGQKLNLLVFMTFPGGERNVTVLQEARTAGKMELVMDFRGSNDIMDLMLTMDALRRMDISVPLIVPYLPYARQDRVCNDGEPLSADVIGSLLLDLCMSKLEVWDPHSDKSVERYPREMITIVEQHELASLFFDGWKKCVIVAPDAGATVKAGKLSHKLRMPLLQAKKHRDPATGDITETSLENWQEFEGHEGKFLVVDDICDGGRTFVGLGKILKTAFPKAELHLYVTHGIFSYGMTPFVGIYEKVYCPNVMNDFLRTFFQFGVFDMENIDLIKKGKS